MSRKSQRELEKTIEQLTDDDSSTREGLVFGLTTVHGSTDPSDTPTPELAVEAYPDKDGFDDYAIAIPYIWPEAYAGEEFVFLIHSGENVTDTWDDHSDGDDGTIEACRLWDAMTDEELQAEYEYRTDHGEPVPEYLEQYGEGV